MGAAAATHRFHVGDRVQVKRENLAGNPRTPAYVRGKSGIVTALHGSIEVRVHDSTSDVRWMVLPRRPAGTQG
jgi:ribosomal protein L21E